MVQNCSQWRHGEKVLALKEEAVEEAQMALARLREGAQMAPGLTENTIKMSEYLGIRVLSEPSLLWIAAEAFSAPLPAGWATHRDASGRMFFYNSTSNTSQWDHPLDGHFRRLRDKHRDELEELVVSVPRPPNVPYFASRPHSAAATGGDAGSRDRVIGVGNDGDFGFSTGLGVTGTGRVGESEGAVVWRDDAQVGALTIPSSAKCYLSHIVLLSCYVLSLVLKSKTHMCSVEYTLILTHINKATPTTARTNASEADIRGHKQRHAPDERSLRFSKKSPTSSVSWADWYVRSTSRGSRRSRWLWFC